MTNKTNNIIPTLQKVKEYIPSDEVEEEINYWNAYLHQIELKLDAKNYYNNIKHFDIIKLNKINIDLNDLFNEIYTFYVYKENNSVIKYYNDIKTICDNHMTELKELLVMNYLINIEYDFYHKYSILGKYDTIKYMLEYLNKLYK